jgi:hypothetical protein
MDERFHVPASCSAENVEPWVDDEEADEGDVGADEESEHPMARVRPMTMGSNLR